MSTEAVVTREELHAILADIFEEHFVKPHIEEMTKLINRVRFIEEALGFAAREALEAEKRLPDYDARNSPFEHAVEVQRRRESLRAVEPE